MTSPKFMVGDTVEFCGNTAIVRVAKENFYFLPANSPYFMYDIELVASGHLCEVSEAALTLISRNYAEKPLSFTPKNDNMCVCGAYSIHWMHGHHAPYCPLGGIYA